ncbi:MAG: ABC transporter substrate-binding protein [Micropruina glycogenica]
MLDPALASDGETFRVAGAAVRGLLGTKPGTTELEPPAGHRLKSHRRNTSFTFTLREGVKFSDGTDFNAEAVCANSTGGSTGPASTSPRTSRTTTAS